MEKNNIPEEVTITPVIRDLERLVLRIIWGIKNIFLWMFRVLLMFVDFVLKNALVIGVAAIIGGLLGVFSMTRFPRGYESTLVLQMNIDAAAQLHTDVIYFSSLIEKEEFDILSSELDISLEEAKSLTGIKIKPYSTHVSRIEKLNQLYENQDTASVYLLDLDEMVKSTDPALFDKYRITVYAAEPTVFSKIESPLLATFENDPSLQSKLRKKRSTLEMEISMLQKEMLGLDSLKGVYVDVLSEQAKSSHPEFDGTIIQLGKNESLNWLDPLNIYRMNSTLTEAIVELNSELVQLDSCFSVEAHFSSYGANSGLGKLSRVAIGAVSIMLLSMLILLLMGRKRS